jgi:hypothetical protein
MKLLFDETGRRPLPPAPAFEQVIHGRPWKLLTSDDLLYLPRNPRPGRAYGFAPVEQIVMTVNIGLRRQAMQLQHFTEGNVPPGLLNAPDGWNVEQVRQFQEWFDSVLAGNTGGRSRLVWGPSGTKYQPFKEAPYKDEFDEWLARIVCYAFSLPSTAFTRQVNRATAETAQDAALAEGLAPLQGWVKRLCDHVIQDRLGHPDLEWAWADQRPADPAEQAKTLDLYVRAGVYTINEARTALGLDPIPGGDAARIYGTAGAVPLAAPGDGAATKRAATIYKDFNPDQPRAPAGSSDGGEWTDGGESGESSGSSAGHVTDPGVGLSEPVSTHAEHIWERFPNPDFRDKLAIAEQTASKPNFGYGEVNPRSGALGRYQMLPDALRATRMIDANGTWTGKYGVHSRVQFLTNPDAQERALTDFLDDTERQLRANGSFNYIGTKIDGRVAPFIVTRAGLIAAGHREGAKATLSYLTALQDSAFSSAKAGVTREGLRIETRLRTFANAPYE